MICIGDSKNLAKSAKKESAIPREEKRILQTYQVQCAKFPAVEGIDHIEEQKPLTCEPIREARPLKAVPELVMGLSFFITIF